MKTILQSPILILFLSTVFSQPKGVNEIEGEKTKTVIVGRVLNFEKHKSNRTISFDFTNLFELDEEYVVTIKSDGSFKINIPIYYVQDFYLSYGYVFATHLIRPGDSLYMEIDADILDNPRNKYPNQKFFSRVVGGDLVNENKQITEILELLVKSSDNEIKNKSPEAYRTYVANREKKNRAIVETYKEGKDTSALFDLWLNDYLKYQSFDDLMRYRWLRPRAINVPRDSFQLPDSYYSFLDDYDMNDNRIITSNHAYFLQEMFNYLSRQENPIEYIESKATGFTKDFAITYLYVNILSANYLDEFEHYYDSTKVANADFRRIIDREYKKLTSYKRNQDVEKCNLIDIESDITEDLLKNIADKYEGKVIYIDFWATWCAPCLEEMKASKKLQDYFKDRDVVFLFLASQCSEKSWKATIANRQLTGEHLLLNDDQYNILAAEFGIGGVPHYVMIDKDGNVESKNCERPSQKDKVIQIIEELLE